MGENLTIREFREEDADRIVELHKDTVRSVNSENYSEAEIDAWTEGAEELGEKDEDSFMIVAVMGGTIVGFGELKEKEIKAMYVDRDHHGEGIGSALLHELEDIAREKGFDTVELESTIAARPFYERHGYELVEETTHEFGDQELEVFAMEKDMD